METDKRERKKKYSGKAVIEKYQSGRFYRIPEQELLDAIKELTGNALKLFLYYFTKGSGWTFKDEEIAILLDVTEKTIAANRRELIDKKFLLIVEGKEIDNYFLGKTKVHKWISRLEDPSSASETFEDDGSVLE